METSYKYKLKCVINHIGSSYYGHYNTDIVIDENRSIKIDDLNLKLNTNKIKDVNNCYVLFYEKVKK
jgi:ubiquitin C-terminal hydrolase